MEIKELILKEEEFLRLFDNGYYNTDEGLIDFFELRDSFSLIEKKTHESRRWVTPISEYYRVEDRYFCFNWAVGNTEYQEDEYYNLTEMYPPRTITKIAYEWDIKEK